MTTLRAMLRARLGFPWAVLAYVTGCVLTTAPMLVDRRYYLVLGVGHEDADNPSIHFWHIFVTTFVHGGGFPGTVPHLLINCAFFLVLGTILERALGSGRFFALCLACLAMSWGLKAGLGRYAHGISSVNWAFVDFAPLVLAHGWRTERGRAFRDPAFIAVALLLIVGLIGLANPWHAIAMLVGMPFALAWRSVLRENLERMERREPLDRWGAAWRRIGIAVPVALAAFSVAMAAAAVLGRVP